jgi:hypothetical protein
MIKHTYILSYITSLLLAVLQARVGWAQEAEARGPDRAALARAGQATIKRLEKEAASWTATTHLPGNTQVIVEVIGTPSERRTVLRIEAPGGAAELLRIIVRDGVWYATEGQRRGKYRPYEAPFNIPTAYFFLPRSDPQCLVATKGGDLGAYEGTTAGIATFRTPLDEPVRRQLQSIVNQFREIKKRNPEEAAKPELARPVERIGDLLAHGIPTKIEVASGMIVQFGAAERQTELHNFRWLDWVNPKELEISGRQWEDFTDDPTLGGTSELVMISHSGMWQPGLRSPDTDGRLLDLRTGRFRRIPFHGSTALPGCFLRDRSRAIISGLDALEGVMSLVEVNLRNGDNRKLGGELLAGGFTLMPALSPDGRAIAALHKGSAGRILDSQVCLVDLKTGAAKMLGTPRDMAFLSWLPDGKGLLLLVRESLDPSDPVAATTSTVARMDMEGRITKIGEGGSPVLLGDGKTILYQDTKSHQWSTCDLSGANVRLFGDGLAGYGFPSPAPDGQRIMMMHFRPDKAPEPMIFRIGDSKGTPATTAPGLWAAPAWR